MRPWHRRALAAAMIVVMVAELCFLFAGWEPARTIAHGAMLAFLIIGAPLIRLREAYMLGAALVLSLLTLLLSADPAGIFPRALDQAAFLVTFILSIGLLREAAVTSPAVLSCGIFMTRQPSGRRYIAVQVGASFIGALINLGALSLLAPLIQRGVREDQAKGASHYVVARVRERRQLTALIRGFAWQLAWSPTTVTLGILATVIPGIHLLELVGAGLALSAVMLGIGWIEDRIRFRGLRKLLTTHGWMPEAPSTPFPTRAFLSLLAVCAGLAALTILFRALGHVQTVPGLLLACPVVLAVWVLAQNIGPGLDHGLAAVGARIRHAAGTAIPMSAREAMTLSASGYIGVVGASLIPMEQVAGSLALSALPEWLFLLFLPTLMVAVGQLGPSPVMMVILLSTLLGQMPQLPASPTLTAIALACGGALATTASPFASGVLVLSRVSGHPATAISWRWNLPFAFAGIAVLAVLFPLLTGGK